MEKLKSDLEELKKKYSEIQKKHKLPSFEELNKDFAIEKIAETETDFLIRNIRVCIGETLENFLRFVEAILNPINSPMFMYPIIKAVGNDEKEKLMNLLKEISKLEIEMMKMIEYSEEKEAEFIKKSFKLWQSIKKDFLEFVETIEKKIDFKSETDVKGYFG